MSASEPARAPAGVDVPALTAWLADHVPAILAPIDVETISAGRSNLTYALEDSTGARYVLRRPPMGTLAASAHDVGREWRILSALTGSVVPVPNTVAYCAAPDVIGAPFFLMEFVPGPTITWATAGAMSDETKRRVGQSLPRVLAQLHDLDIAEVGLDELRRSRSYVERQLRLWDRQLDGRVAPSVDLLREVGAELAELVPRTQRNRLLHGDFKLENMILSPTGEVSAVLDWELAAVGDPLADLGWLLVWWAEPGDTGRWITSPATLAGGFPDREALIRVYRENAAVDISELPFYMAFSYWRLSCINTTTRARFVAGAMGHKQLDLAALDAQVEWQLEAARKLLTECR